MAKEIVLYKTDFKDHSYWYYLIDYLELNYEVPAYKIECITVDVSGAKATE